MFFSLLSSTSCQNRKSLSTLAFEDTPILSVDERIALVVDPYVSLRDIPGPGGITIAHARRGDIFTITGKRLLIDGQNRMLWFNLGEGWVLSTAVQLYSSRARAESASRLLRE